MPGSPAAPILLTGGGGRLGRALRALDPTVAAPGRDELDVTDERSVAAAFARAAPAIVIHAAALVGSRECAADPERALAVNVAGTANVARACLRHGCRLVHVSTDYVFDGRRGGYTEDDPPSPTTVYGRTKLAGEWAARSVPNTLVVRTSFYEPGRWPFPGAFVDQHGSRLPVAEAAAELLAAAASALTGVIHIAGPRRSVFDIARACDPRVEPLRRADVAGGLDLPADVSLDDRRWRAHRRRGLASAAGTPTDLSGSHAA